jgi:hypothetical protein
VFEGLIGELRGSCCVHNYMLGVGLWEMVSGVVVAELVLGEVLIGGWWSRMLPSTSYFLSRANSLAVRAEDAGGGDADA